jgi:hypothetical protein
VQSISSTTVVYADRPKHDRTALFFRAAKQILEFVVFGVLPLLLLASFLGGGRARGFDFQQFWQGGHDVAHGVSPYAEIDALPDAATARALDPEHIREVFRFPYPAPTALVLAPFGLLPLAVAKGIFLALLVACILGVLVVLRVRDWRCYGLTFLWLPVLSAVRLGTLTPLLMLGTALAWRYRDRKMLAASAVALAVALKLFLWPLFVWFAATRRIGTGLIAATLAAALMIASWAALGFAGFTTYPTFLGNLSAAVEDKGYSITALTLAAGGSAGAGHLLGFAIGGLLLVAALRARINKGGDTAILALMVAAGLAISPIVWLHYFALLLVPVAASNPRLSIAWAVPVALWTTPNTWKQSPWQIVVALLIGVVTVILSARDTAEDEKPQVVRRVTARGADDDASQGRRVSKRCHPFRTKAD